MCLGPGNELQSGGLLAAAVGQHQGPVQPRLWPDLLRRTLHHWRKGLAGLVGVALQQVHVAHQSHSFLRRPLALHGPQQEGPGLVGALLHEGHRGESAQGAAVLRLQGQQGLVPGGRLGAIAQRPLQARSTLQRLAALRVRPRSALEQLQSLPALLEPGELHEGLGMRGRQLQGALQVHLRFSRPARRRRAHLHSSELGVPIRIPRLELHQLLQSSQLAPLITIHRGRGCQPLPCGHTAAVRSHCVLPGSERLSGLPKALLELRKIDMQSGRLLCRSQLGGLLHDPHRVDRSALLEQQLPVAPVQRQARRGRRQSYAVDIQSIVEAACPNVKTGKCL
mmetsp:Transcript_27948/g.80036  ORF Transcript_27948/g.80036 Transcript_27948/m.80036 type:complete len:337 (+) Transcript_27948:1695-2705(+)